MVLIDQTFQVVNKYFSVFAGIISFWIPTSIMVYVYAMVYKEMLRLQSAFSSGQHVTLASKVSDKSGRSQESLEQVREDKSGTWLKVETT